MDISFGMGASALGGQAFLCLGALGTASIFPPYGEFLWQRELVHLGSCFSVTWPLCSAFIAPRVGHFDTRQVGGIKLIADLWLKTGLSQPSPSEPL